MDKKWTRSELNLAKKGLEKGVLTYREITEHLSADMHDPDQIEAFVNMIKDFGVLVYDDSQTPKDRIVPWRKPRVRRTVQQFFGTPAPDNEGGLTALESKLLRMRFGIGMDTHHTLAEAAEHLDLPRERIRQIETKALSKLRVPVNFASEKEAVKWLHRAAAEHGYAQAQSDLGFMYEHGKGVPQDLIKSHAWYNSQDLAKKWAAEHKSE